MQSMGQELQGLRKQGCARSPSLQEGNVLGEEKDCQYLCLCLGMNSVGYRARVENKLYPLEPSGQPETL